MTAEKEERIDEKRLAAKYRLVIKTTNTISRAEEIVFEAQQRVLELENLETNVSLRGRHSQQFISLITVNDQLNRVLKELYSQARDIQTGLRSTKANDK